MDRHRSTLAGHPDVGPILPVFVGRLPGYVSDLRRSMAAGDWEAVRRLAHQLKGVGKSYGFEGMSELGGRVQDEIVAGKMPMGEVQALVEYIERVEGYAGDKAVREPREGGTPTMR